MTDALDRGCMKLIPKNWDTFQHYKDRCPPWIKLHRDILTNYEFSILPIEAKAIAPLLWLLAAESKNGEIDLSLDALAFRLHIDSKTIASAIKSLIDKGFFIDASNTLADCYQVAIPETETEIETKKERETKTDSATKLLANFGIEGELAKDFINHRKSKKASITQTVMSGFQREADKAGISIIDAVTISIERNWQSFKAEWHQNQTVTTPQQKQPAISEAEINKAARPGESRDQVYRRLMASRDK